MNRAIRHAKAGGQIDEGETFRLLCQRFDQTEATIYRGDGHWK